ncbi:alpha-2-macroglobulin-like protein 1 [Hyla sarda]|uniref:alpha-2-macroglobulin-like protein 1 n=1 Tax=Hyla sarda TaxID=327740 RepID=UPI0024C3E579|nr:alpha-2-macroglobulin-like protein 1 [Hyla sarda]XP_056385128.1 alpha-2-macroglobulin-like protein 1 [Hyla sarda]
MWLLLVPVFLAIFGSSLTSASEPHYVITVPAHLEEGTEGKACVAFLDLKGETDIKIKLKHEEQVHIIAEHKVTKHDHSECYAFQVPKIKDDHLIWNLHLSARGENINVDESKKVAIIKREDECVIHTDKSTYKPGDTVKFQVISVNSDFQPISKEHPLLEIIDPNTNRIAQWLNVSTKQGFADFSFHLDKQLAHGNYKIIIPPGCVKYFKVDKYVPKRFELNLNIPSEVSMTDKSFQLKACGSYTYGKPVEGVIDLSVCAEVCKYRWYCKSHSSSVKKTAKKNCIDIKQEKTDDKGCVSRDIQLGHFNLSTTEQHFFRINSKLTEDGTGHSEETSAHLYSTSAKKIVQFEESKRFYDKGFPYHGKVKVSNEKNQPLVNEVVRLYIIKNDDYSNATHINLVTDSEGIAHFTLKTSGWPDVLMLKVRLLLDDHEDDDDNIWDHVDSSSQDSLWLLLFYSKSESLLSIQEHPSDVSCHSEQSVMVEYDIHKKILHSDTDQLHFFYILLSKSGIFSYKEHTVDVKDQAKSPNLQGSFPLNFHVEEGFFPRFGLLVFSVLPNGETIARAKNYIVSPCGKSKVKLSFSKEQVRPGENVNLEVTAEAGSLCSVRSVDKGYLLKNPHSDNNLISDVIEKLRNSVYKDEHTDLIMDSDDDRCPKNTSPITENNYDVYKLFLTHSLQILTNTEIKEPVKCVPRALTTRSAVEKKKTKHIDTDKKAEKQFTQSYFSDTWLYELVPVGSEGHTVLNRTTPNTITKWVTDAFCLGSSGFASVKDVELTTFQPYFIDLIAPYSVVQGKTFTIQAVVFSYVKKCILIVVSLSDSENLVIASKKEQARCVCEGLSHTFSWDVSALKPKTLKIHIDSESIEVEGKCTQDVLLVGKDRIKDSVEKTIVVKV